MSQILDINGYPLKKGDRVKIVSDRVLTWDRSAKDKIFVISGFTPDNCLIFTESHHVLSGNWLPFRFKRINSTLVKEIL